MEEMMSLTEDTPPQLLHEGFTLHDLGLDLAELWRIGFKAHRP